VLGLDHETQHPMPLLVPVVRGVGDVHHEDAVRQVPAMAQGHQALVVVHVERAEVLVLLHQPCLAGADEHPLHL